MPWKDCPEQYVPHIYFRVHTSCHCLAAGAWQCPTHVIHYSIPATVFRELQARIVHGEGHALVTPTATDLDDNDDKYSKIEGTP